MRVMEGHITIGMLIAFQGLVLQFTGPVSGLFALMDRVQRLRGDVQRLDDVLDYAVDPVAAGVPLYSRDPGRADAGPTKLAGFLELKDVSFGYNANEDPPLREFSRR